MGSSPITPQGEAAIDGCGHAPPVSFPSRYVIEVDGRVPSSLASELPGFAVEDRGGSTVVAGDVADGAALYGLLARLEALGLQLVSVRPKSPAPETAWVKADDPRR